MTKISIKIRNHFGVNSFRGEDLDPESAKHLMDVATEMIKADRVSLATPLPYMTTTYLGGDEIEQGVFDTETGIHTPITAPLMTPALQGQPAQHVSMATPAPIMTPAEVAATQTATEPPLTAGQAAQRMMDRIVENSVTKHSEPPAHVEPTEDKLQSGSTLKTTTEPVKILSMEERCAEMSKDYFTTGIKYRERHGEIIPHYRLRYNCPKCNEQGNHYVPENVKSVFCHSCSQPLIPKQATKKFLEKDEWGNFFVANEMNTKFMKA